MTAIAALPPRDADGFLLEQADWNEQVAGELAREEGLVLTPAHRAVLHMLQAAYYREHEHAPAMRALVSLTRRTLGPEKGRSVYLLGLFPGSPARVAAKIAGLPAPSTACEQAHAPVRAIVIVPRGTSLRPSCARSGRGRRGARSLEREEARTALRMILDGEADPLQTGAFLMLLRVKEETAEEIAGFVQAARERAQLPEAPIIVDLDWPTYAGKRQQPPWYLLSALLLATHGHRVLMHGCEPHARNRLFAAQALPALGIAAARDWQEVREALDTRRFAYAPLALFSPGLQALLNLRHLFGLRSPVNTFVRHMNPLAAPATMQSLQHPAYAVLHAGAARQLGSRAR
ncbi:MAG: glycosyl transferase family protein [Gammaproteobacteria bacterium]|nr:glycosyl transferase family protein [Gammaproteobacteria bacterium]